MLTYCFSCPNGCGEYELKLTLDEPNGPVICGECSGELARNYRAEMVNVRPRMVLRQTELRTDAEDLSPRA